MSWRCPDTATEFLDAGDPVVSVDTKKKEVVGEYAGKGRAWRPEGEPTRVSTHDFPGPAGKAIPYGIYDLASNTGWVSVGCDHGTAAFAVNTLRSWWRDKGRITYPAARPCRSCDRCIYESIIDESFLLV